MDELRNFDELLAPHLGPNRKIVNLEISKPPPKGVGSVMLKAKVTVKNQDGREELLHLMAKKIPAVESTRQAFDIQNTFKKEVAFYEVILPTLKQFQEEEGVADVLDNFPEFYGARFNLKGDSEVVDEDAVMVLEDLSVKGFINQNPKVGFNLECIKITLADLAKFNGVCIALKLKKPDVFARKLKRFCSSLHFDENSTKKLMADLKVFYLENPDTVVLAQKATSYLQKKPALPREPYACLVHCDLWTNNTMQIIRNDKIEKNIFIDFQLLDYRSCASDVFFHIWVCGDDNVIRNHIDDLLERYHDELVKTLRVHKVDTSEFSYERFLDELRLVAEFEFRHSLVFATMLKTIDKMPSGDMEDFVIDLSKMTEETKDFLFYMATECHKQGWL